MNFTFRLLSSLGALLLWANALWAAPNEQKEIQELYRRGLTGDKEAVEQCIARLEEVLAQQPGNQLARVYLGSAYTLRSRDLGFGPKKLQALRQGLAMMDEAVTTAPEDQKVRLARALTTSALPAILGRAASSRKDFAVLAEQAMRAPGTLGAGELQVVFYHAGLAAKATGDKARAIALWKEALTHPKDAKLSEKINVEIAQAH
jgi:tetratricopeptide (TPR) repeat protein